MKPNHKDVALVIFLLAFAPLVQAGDECSISTITGTYAFNFTGASTIVAGVAEDTLHWNALHGPIAGVGVWTVKPDGSADGYYWIIAGAWNFGLDPIPIHATIEVHSDCTGVMEYQFGDITLSERLVILADGREMRSVVTQTGVPTATWITTARRINGTCGQEKVKGEYLLSCKGLGELPIEPPNIFSGAALIRIQVAKNGDFTGMWYGKQGPIPGESPVTGNLTVYDDCTAEGPLAVEAMPGITNIAKAVFFDQGKNGYLLPLVNLGPDPGQIAPQPFAYCDVTLIER